MENNKKTQRVIKSKQYLTLIAMVVFGLLFLVYRYGFQERYLNVLPQTVEIFLSQTHKVILIEKHAEQKQIDRLELDIRGKLSENTTLYLSEDGVNGVSSVRIKHGKVNTTFVARWHSDKAYIIIDNSNRSKGKLVVEYQFVSNN